MLDDGSSPAIGLGTAAVKYAERLATGILVKTEAGMKFCPRVTGSRCVRLPE